MVCIKRQRSRPAFVTVLAEAESRTAAAVAFLDKGRACYHAYARWVTHRSERILAGLKLTTLPSMEEIVSQSEQLCREYIYSRLKRYSMLTPKLETLAGAGIPNTNTSEVSREIQMLGGELEKMYPDLYESISKQLHVTMASEALVRKTFAAIAEQLFRGSVTWGKIVALYAIASALCCDCTGQGHPEFAAVVIDTFGKVTQKYTGAWIIRQGGWIDVIRAFRTTPEAPVVWSFSFLGVLIGCAFVLLATVNL